MSDRLIRLRDFMGKTMKASEAAKANGDQDGVDRYGDFLDRAGVVAEREMSGGGPQDIGFTPQDIGGGQMPGQLAPPPELPTGKAADVLSQERDLEANPFAPKGVTVGRRESVMTPDPLAGDEAIRAQRLAEYPSLPKSGPAGVKRLSPRDVNLESAGDIFGSMVKPALLTNPATMPFAAGKEGIDASGSLADMILGESGPGGVTKTATKPPPFSDEGLGEVDRMPQSEINLSMEDEVANAKAGGEQPDKVVNDVAKFATDAKEAEVARRIQKYLGEKPEFFSWENIIMMLLIGAPRAYQSYVSKKRDYQKGVLGIEQDVENKVARQDENKVREDRLKLQSDMDYYKSLALMSGKSDDRNVRAAIAMMNKAGSGMTSMAQATMGQDLEKNDEYQAWKRKYETAKEALENLTTKKPKKPIPGALEAEEQQ